MQASRSLNAIHTRRLQGRHNPNHLSTSSLPNPSSSSLSSFDPSQPANSHSTKRPSESPKSGATSHTWPIQSQDKSSIWLRDLRKKTKWKSCGLFFVTYLVASLCVLTNDLLQLFKPAYLLHATWTADDRRVLSRMLPDISMPSHNPLKSFLSRDQTPFKKWKASIEITACVVADESELPHLDEWAVRWNGPISLLVTTTHPANSRHYNLLARRLSTLGSSSSRSLLPKISPSIKFYGNRVVSHLLSIPLPRRVAPNTNNLLNIARIQSKSNTVMLFPLGLTHPPISNLHDILLQAKLGPDPVIIPRIPHTSSPYPSSNSTKNPNSKSSIVDFIDPGASLFIRKHDQLWCPERFFTTSPPDKNPVEMLGEWVECLWRVMLEHPKSLRFSGSGRAFTFDESPSIVWSGGNTDASDFDLGGKSPVPDIHTQIHESTSAQYRSETCMLIARQYAAQGMWDVTSLQHSNDIGPGPGARNVQETVEKVMHVRKFCEHTLKLWSRYLLEK